VASDDELRYAFGVPRTPGGYRPVPARLRSSEEVYDAPQQHEGDYDFVRTLHDLWSRQWRAASSPVSFMDVFGAAPSRQGGPSSVDPTTRSGLDNWSALFSPGPGGRGGKFVGQRGALEDAFLNQLRNVKGGQPSMSHRLDEDYSLGPEDPVDDLLMSLREPYALRELEPGRGFSRPVQAGQGGQGARRGEGAEQLRAIRKMQALLGYAPRGDPAQFLAQLMTGKSDPRLEEVESKLGLSQDTRPSWFTPPSTIRQIERYPPTSTHGPTDAAERMTYKGFGEEFTDDQRIALASIIATMLRRQQGGSFGRLGQPGSN